MFIVCLTRVHSKDVVSDHVSGSQSFGVTGKHGGLSDVVKSEIQHADSLHSCIRSNYSGTSE